SDALLPPRHVPLPGATAERPARPWPRCRGDGWPGVLQQGPVVAGPGRALWLGVRQCDRPASRARTDRRTRRGRPALLGVSGGRQVRGQARQVAAGRARQGCCTSGDAMNALMDEYGLETRLGFESALRRYAFPPATGSEVVAGLRWILDSPANHRQE